MDKTEVEKTLNSQVFEYEKAYFEDMAFQPGSITGDIFVECEQQIFSKQKWKEYWDIPGAGFHLSIKQCPFRLNEFIDSKTPRRVALKIGEIILAYIKEF
jgi:hypothetical protein